MNQITINVWGSQVVVEVKQRSDGVWLATGRYEGQPIEGEGPTADAAVDDWRYWACKPRS